MIRETEAEAVAYVVNRTVGLEGSAKSVDYIQLWNGDEAVLLQSLECIRDVSSRIITELEASVSEEMSRVAWNSAGHGRCRPCQ